MGDREGGEQVIALNLADGKELWSARIGEVWEPQGYAGPRRLPRSMAIGSMLWVRTAIWYVLTRPRASKSGLAT